MKKPRYIWIAICTMFLLPACTAGQPGSTAGEPSQGSTWQEQYDLGVRYLSEGNYQEAIIAFTAAIEIDPKQASAYVGRGDAYVKSGETESNLAAALTDYEKAIELDESSAEAYLGLADVYIRQGDYEKAREILAQGVDKTGSEALQEMLDGIFVEETDANGLNAYGAKAFTLREEYVPFVELSAEGQEFISQAATATIQNDRDTLLSLSETVALALPIGSENSDRTLYTVWNQHKIYVTINTAGIDDEGVYSNYIWDIQIRPQNGVGYYAYVWRMVGIDASKNSNNWFYEYSDNTTIISCFCSDWQWNGLLDMQSFGDALQRMDDGALRKMQRNKYVTGQMNESLREGAFTVVEETLDEYPDNPDADYYYKNQYTENFNAGEYIGYSGEYISGNKSVGRIYSIEDSHIANNFGYDKHANAYYW